MRSLRSSLLGLAAMVGLSAGSAAQAEAPAPKAEPQPKPKKVTTTRGQHNVAPVNVRKVLSSNHKLPKQQQVDIQDLAEAKRLRKQARPQGHYAG